MALLETRVEQLIGPVSEQVILSDNLTNAARVVIEALPAGALETSDITVPVGGVDVSDKRIIYVHKGGRVSKLFPASTKAVLADANSLFQASSFTPYHYVEHRKLYVLPGGGTAAGVAFPTLLFDDETIPGLPLELYELVLLLAAAYHRQMQAIQFVLPDPIDYAIPPALPELATVTIDLAALTWPADPFEIPTFNTAELEPPVLAPFVLDPLVVFPTPPTYPVGTFDWVDADGGTLPSQFTDVGIGWTFGTAQPTFTAPAALDLTTAIAELTSEIDTDDAEMAAQVVNKIQVLLQDHQRKWQEAVDNFNRSMAFYKEDWQEYMDIGRLEQERLATQFQQDGDFSKFNKVQTWQSLLQKEQLRQEYHKLAIEKYRSDVNDRVQVYQTEEIGHKLGLWQQEAALRLQHWLGAIEAVVGLPRIYAELNGAIISAAAAEMDAVSRNNRDLLDLYAADTQRFAAETQHMASFLQGEIARYGGLRQGLLEDAKVLMERFEGVMKSTERRYKPVNMEA